jgi:hypothetical protein
MSDNSVAQELDVPALRATYTKSKTTAEYLVRLVGPDACNAAGSTVPVSNAFGVTEDDVLEWVDKERHHPPLTSRRSKNRGVQ